MTLYLRELFGGLLLDWWRRRWCCRWCFGVLRLSLLLRVRPAEEVIVDVVVGITGAPILLCVTCGDWSITVYVAGQLLDAMLDFVCVPDEVVLPPFVGPS